VHRRECGNLAELAHRTVCQAAEQLCDIRASDLVKFLLTLYIRVVRLRDWLNKDKPALFHNSPDKLRAQVG
jgi:hypothetical protein